MLTLLKRMAMILLLFGAVLGIWFSTVNPSLTEGETWSTGDKTDSAVSPAKAEFRETALEDKALKIEEQQERHISSEHVDGPQTLEEYVEAQDYPSETVTATGYTAGAESTGKTSEHPQYGITYSGVPVKRDLYSTIAADLDVYPIGTVMFIPGYGYGVVADKGEAITGNKIDLYFETVDDVYSEWGKQDVDVSIIEEGDGELTEETLNNLNDDEAQQVFRDQVLEE